MRRDEILDLLLLEADGGLSPAESARLEEAVAGDPTLQLERVSIRAAWRELQSLGRFIATGRAEFDDASVADSRLSATTSARQPPNRRDSASSPARRRRKSRRERE